MSIDVANIRPIPEHELRALRQPMPESSKSALAMWVPSWQEGQPVHLGGNFQNAVTYGWQRNELIYACIMAKARARAMVTLRVEDATTDEELEEHPFRELLERPNPFMTEYAFHAAVVVYQSLSGHSYWEIIRSRAGLPVQLWPLRPDWVKPVLGSQGLLGWVYGRPGQEPAKLKANQVLDIPLFDPTNLYGGTSPTMVVGMTGDTDNAITRFAKDFFERGALPAGMLTIDSVLKQDDIDRARTMWAQRYGGASNWVAAPAILDKSYTYQKISTSIQETGLDIIDGRDEARICATFGVPPIMVGAKVGLDRATYSNAEQAETHFWRNTVMPELKHEADWLAVLAAEFGDIDLDWDYRDVPALQEDEGTVWTKAKDALDGGGIMVDEYREMIGLEVLPDKKGQVFLRLVKYQEVPLELAGTGVGLPSTDDPDEIDDIGSESEGDVGNTAGSGTADQSTPSQPTGGQGPGTAQDVSKSNGYHNGRGSVAVLERTQVKAKAKPVAAPDDAARRKHERQMQTALEAFFGEQLTRIEQQLRRSP